MKHTQNIIKMHPKEKYKNKTNNNVQSYKQLPTTNPTQLTQLINPQ